MTAQSDPYVRVYYSILSDERFEKIYPNNDALATWLRLLLIADGAYPAPAHLPGTVKKSALNLLIEVGLVDLLPGGLYRIHGLQAERERRAQVGRTGANARWSQSDRNANALPPQSERNAKAMHSEPLRTEPIQSAPNRSAPAPAGAAKNGSKTPETDAERLARYRSYIGDKSKSADIREAAAKEVELIESRMAVH
jgi:hypothetical protein